MRALTQRKRRRRERFNSTKKNSRRPLLEPLEDRILLSLFGHTFDDINPNQSDLDPQDPDGASMGRVNGLASVAGDNRTLYAASEFGGIFKSFDRGLTWDHLDGHIPQATWDVEVDPLNPSRVYATSYYDGRVDPITGIQVSNDGGVTWTHPLTAHPDPALEGTPNDNTPNAGYDPGGNMQNTIRRNEPGAYGISIRSDAPNNVVIGTNAGVAISNDSGATWRFIDPDNDGVLSNVWDVLWQPGGANGIIDVVGDSGHHRSTDGGMNWTADSLPAAATNNLSSLSIGASPDESYVLYVVGTDNMLYESIDADQAVPTWTPIGQTDPVTPGGGRLPFVAISDTTAGFNLWTGGVLLFRATGTTPGNPMSGVGGSRINAPGAWAGPFTRGGAAALPPPAFQAAHDDVGDVVFDTEVPNDAIPVLYSSDGGVYVNTNIGDVAGASNIALVPIVITTARPHGLFTGDTVRISNVEGNTAANGTFTILVFTPTTFGIPVFGNGDYVAGTGHWHLVSQTPSWEQPDRGPHALWIFGFAGVDQPGANSEDIYIGMQDSGTFANTAVGQDDPNAVAAAWHQPNCCDSNHFAADQDTVLYDQGFASPRAFPFRLGDRGLTSAPRFDDPADYPLTGGTTIPGFKIAESIALWGDDSYAILMDDGGGDDGGLFISSNVTNAGGGGANVTWTELGNASETAQGMPSNNYADLQVAFSGGTPSFFVTVGGGNAYTSDQLWRFDGTNAAGNWQRLDTNINPADPNPGVSLFAVDPNNPNRLYASYIDSMTGPRMVFSTNGGMNWQNDPGLDFLMTGGGAFNMMMQRGPRNFPDQEDSGSSSRGIGTSYQPSLLAYDPEDPNIIVAGARDAGIFISTDSGSSWRLITDPFGTDDDPSTTLANGLPLDDTPHISRPHFVHFDHETDNLVNLYVGTQGRGVWRIGVNFDKEPDRFEPNNSIGSATVLGSLQKITLNNLSIHDVNDVDFYQYTAQDTGKLIVNMYHNALAGDLDLRVRDGAGNIVATASLTASPPPSSNEQLVIPVVSQERYYIEVSSPLGHTNCYDLEIENFPAPVPIAIDLAAVDDTGKSDSDNVTFDPLGTITILADLFDFASMGIDILTPAEVTANEPGAAVEVFVRGVSRGFATGLVGTNSTLFDFTFGAGDLLEGLNFVTAAVHIFDGKIPQADGRSQLSEPLLLTLDTTAPATPGAPNLLAASDSGTFDDDNVTNKMEPAFDGATERNALVRVRADGVVVGEGLSSSSGQWEITVEPLRDDVHAMTVVVEDLAGNVSDASAALDVEIDTLAPNTAHLDLVETSDTGRHNDDNITMDNTPDMSATTQDLPATGAASHINATNLKYRIFDRLEESAETLVYFSALTSATQVTTTLAALADGIHNLKLEVEDRAGNISHDFLLDVLIDTVAPNGTVNLHPDSDSGVWGHPETLGDGITDDTVPLLYGATEANALVRIALDIDENPPDGLPDGTSVALPYDGDDAFPPPPEFDGNYFLQTILMLADGEHTLTAFFQDVAGNETAADDAPELTIFIDTQGPKITNVTRGLVSTDNIFSFDGVTSLFQPKPSDNGPDPLVHSIVVHFSDLPDRTAMFPYDALLEALAAEEGNYQLVGDHNGNIAIVDVNVTFTTTPDDGLPEEAEVELVFDAPLPDDRFTLLVDDSIADPAGNALDGESGAQAPFEGNDVPDETPPIFPTGDGVHGGDFYGRFTIDSRPEIGTFALGTIYVDINGNFVFDPEGKDRDYTNRDIVFSFGNRDDRVFAGNFAEEGASSASGYDKLGAYGILDGLGGKAWRWRLDFNHDGVIDFEVISGKQIAADPVAGNFDFALSGGITDDHPGDEVGLFDGTSWYLDTNGNNNIDGGDTQLRGNMRGFPVVGDFDGDGLDDLGTWNPGNEGQQTKGTFSFDFADNGYTGDAEATIEFDLAGVFERPVAADMNADGIDDLGLFVERREGVVPEESGEWFFLISDDPTPTPGAVTALNHPHTPVPFGTDIFAQFGDEAATPIVGNFDPPSGPLPEMQPAGQNVAAIFRNGMWYFDTADDGGAGEKKIAFGLPGDLPVLGDWDGDGTDEPAVVRNGVWYFDSGDGGLAERAYAFGIPSDVPIAADWDGDGIDEPAVFRDGMWYFDMDGRGGKAEFALHFGIPGDLPVAGDWDGGGADDLGLFRNGKWYMDMDAQGGVGERFVHFGIPGDRPAVGDWDGNGFEDLAVFRGGRWYFDTDGQGGVGERTLLFGIPGDVPLAYHFLPAQPAEQPPTQDPGDPTLPPSDQTGTGTGDGTFTSLSASDDLSNSGLPSSAPATNGAVAPLHGADPDSERNDPDLVDGVFDEYGDLQDDLLDQLAAGVVG